MARGTIQTEMDQQSATIGGYEILEEIARGGMGVVYRARQRRLNRVVALKVMLPGIFASAAQVQRFKAEAQIVAALNHPNIISIHEVGEENGTYFFSMPLVEGKDLSKLGPVDNMTAARCVEKVAQAVYHAHQRGVLHRDLKPNNVLIDREDEPHVVDFGIAKLTDESRTLTQTGESLGTPSYMAPEQVHADGAPISVATDIYALGGILYFLLTGRAPFAEGSREQILWSVFYDEPAKPSFFQPEVARDLEVICLKCLAKDPAQRYATAGELADDLRRFQNQEPISAQPASVWQRTGLWARRNPALALSILAVIAALSYGIIAQQLALRQAKKARADAENLIEFMDKELADKLRPLGRLDLTGDVIRKAEAYFRDQDEAKSGPAFLIRKASFFWRAGTLERELGKIPEARQMAANGLATLDRFQKQNAHDAEAWSLRSDLELLQFRIAKTLGNKPDARQFSTRALADQRKALEMAPNQPKTITKLSEVLMELEEFLRGEGDSAHAEGMLREAGEKLRVLAKEYPDNLEVRRALAIVHYHKACALEDAHDNAAALSEYKLFTRSLEEIAHTAADDRDWQYELAIAYGRAASAHFALSDVEVSEALIAKWRTTAENLARFDPNNVNWRASFAQSLAWSALVMRNKDETDKQIPEFLTRAIEIYEQLSIQNPNEEEYFSRINQLSAELELHYRVNNLPGDAEKIWESNLNRQWETAVRYPWRLTQQKRLAQAFEKLTHFLASEGRSEEAAKLCRRWTEELPKRFEEAPAPQLWHWPLARVHGLLGDMATHAQRLDDAVAEWRIGIDLLKGLQSRTAPAETAGELVHAFASLVSAHQKQEDSRRLAAVATEALDWIEGSPARTPALVAYLCGLILEKAFALQNGGDLVEELAGRCQKLNGLNPVQSSGNAASQ